MTNRPWLRVFASIAVAAWVSSAALGQGLMDGTTPPGIAPGAALSGQPLSNLEMINLFSGALNFSVPVLSVGGRGEVGYSLKVPVETRWIDNSAPDGFGGNYDYLDGEPVGINFVGFSPGYLQTRRGVEEGTCNDSTLHELYTLTRLHWIQANGDDQELIDLKSAGTPEPTSICSGTWSYYARGREFVSIDGSGMTFKIDDAAPEATDDAGYILGGGFLLLKNGSRYRIEGGQVQWMEDRNGNRITFDRTGDVYNRPVTITDPLGRAITIEYGGPPGYTLHANEDWIKFLGAGSAQRVIKIRSATLSDLLRDGGSAQTLAQLFRNGYYASGAGAGVYNPTLTKEIEFPNGQKYQFLYNQYGELSRVTLPTGGKVEYEWASGTIDPDGLFSPMIYRRLQQRRSYTLSGLEGTTVYAAPSLTDPAPNLIVQANEQDPAGTSLRNTVSVFFGSPVSAKDTLPYGYARWKDGHIYQEQVEDESGGVISSTQRTWQQRDWATSASVDSPDDAKPSDPRVTDIQRTLGSLTSHTSYIFSLDPYSNVTSECDYDFGAATAFKCVTRGFQTSAAYTATGVNIRDLVTSETTSSPSGTQATTTYVYDEYSGSRAPLVDRPCISQHDPAWTPSYVYRGNPTTVSRWIAGATYNQVQYDYDIAGSVVAVRGPQVSTPTGLQTPSTSITYTDNFDSNPAIPTYAFPTSIVHPGNLTTSAKFD